jgi:peptidoglycan/xylan/chitin deacetylase (PgdA/CDA1 family)
MKWFVAGLAAATIVHMGPSATALRRFRIRVFPALAGVGDPSHVALTFDDGPDPLSTPQFLDELARYGVQATFFVLGAELVRHQWLGRELAAAGHEVGVHGWDHGFLGPRLAGRRADVATTADLVAGLTGQRPRWFRPPYGILTTAALVAVRRERLAPVLWSCWGRDWLPGSTRDRVLRTLRPDLRPGATVLLHDRTRAAAGWRSSLAALPDLMAWCTELGLRVGPLSGHGLSTVCS